MKKEQQTKRDVVPAVSQNHRHRRLMFAQPYPREFLCCICHAKKPHQQLLAAHCPEGFLVRLLHTVFPSQGHLQIRWLCPQPRHIPGLTTRASGHPRPGGAGGGQGRLPAGGVRPNPPTLSALLCLRRVVTDIFFLGMERRSKSRRKNEQGW